MPKVKQAFRDGSTWRAYAVGDSYEGPRADELAALGLFEPDVPGAPKESDDLPSMTAAELRAMAAGLGLDVPSKAKKADIIAAIEAARGE